MGHPKNLDQPDQSTTAYTTHRKTEVSRRVSEHTQPESTRTFVCLCSGYQTLFLPSVWTWAHTRFRVEWKVAGSAGRSGYTLARTPGHTPSNEAGHSDLRYLHVGMQWYE